MSFCSSAIYAGLVVFTAITIEVCYGNQWGSECSKSTYADSNKQAFFVLDCSGGQLRAERCVQGSQTYTYKSYHCSNGAGDEAPLSGNIGDDIDLLISVELGWTCTVSWGYEDRREIWADEEDFVESCTIVAAPDLQRGPSYQASVVDTPATLICGTNLTGYPAVTVEWRDNNGSTVTDDDLQFSFASGTDEISLVINKTRLDDSGRWLCVLTNTVGTKEVGIDLQVGFAPNITKVKDPNFAVFSPNGVVLECGTNLSGFPRPNVTWIHNDSVVSENDTAYNETRLQLDQTYASDGGEWSCLIDNGFQPSLEEVVYLSVYETPSEPKNITPNWISESSILLSWDVPDYLGKPPFDFYEISYQSDMNESQIFNATVDRNSTSFILENISLNATYNFTVTAVSVAKGIQGRSQPAEKMNVEVAALRTTPVPGSTPVVTTQAGAATPTTGVSTPKESTPGSTPAEPIRTDITLPVSLASVGVLVLVIVLIAVFAVVVSLLKRRQEKYKFEAADFVLHEPIKISNIVTKKTVSISSFIDHLEWESVIQTRVPNGDHTNTASRSSSQESRTTSNDTIETQEAEVTTPETEEEILYDHCSAELETNYQPYIPHVENEEDPGYIQPSSVTVDTDSSVIDIGAIMDSQSDISSSGET